MSVLALSFATALSFLAPNSLIVAPTGADSFSVPFRGQSDLDAFWCAAGDYVVRGLGKPVDTRIWRASPPPRRSGQGVDFSLSPVPGGKTGFVMLGQDDGSLSAGFARSFCDRPIGGK